MVREIVTVVPIAQRKTQRPAAAFTLIEVMITTVLLVMLVSAGLYALAQLDRFSRRNAEYTSVMALVSGEMEALKGREYNPPTAPFTLTNSVTSNITSIALSADGESYAIQGVIVTVMEPVANGHLATVNGYFTNWNMPYIVSLQNVINSYSNPDE